MGNDTKQRSPAGVDTEILCFTVGASTPQPPGCPLIYYLSLLLNNNAPHSLVPAPQVGGFAAFFLFYIIVS